MNILLIVWGWLKSFNVVKFVGGLIPMDGEKIGKWLYTAIIALAVCFCFSKIMRPNVVTKTVIEHAGTVVQQSAEKQDTVFVGVKLFGLKIGLRI